MASSSPQNSDPQSFPLSRKRPRLYSNKPPSLFPNPLVYNPDLHQTTPHVRDIETLQDHILFHKLGINRDNLDKGIPISVVRQHVGMDEEKLAAKILELKQLENVVVSNYREFKLALQFGSLDTMIVVDDMVSQKDLLKIKDFLRNEKNDYNIERKITIPIHTTPQVADVAVSEEAISLLNVHLNAHKERLNLEPDATRKQELMAAIQQLQHHLHLAEQELATKISSLKTLESVNIYDYQEFKIVARFCTLDTKITVCANVPLGDLQCIKKFLVYEQLDYNIKREVNILKDIPEQLTLKD